MNCPVVQYYAELHEAYARFMQTAIVLSEASECDTVVAVIDFDDNDDVVGVEFLNV